MRSPDDGKLDALPTRTQEFPILPPLPPTDFMHPSVRLLLLAVWLNSIFRSLSMFELV